MEARKMRLAIAKHAQTRGCAVAPAAIREAESFLSSFGAADNEVVFSNMINGLLDVIAALGEDKAHIQKDEMVKAINQYRTQVQSAGAESSNVVVVPLHEVPRVEWDGVRSGFVTRTGTRPLLPAPSDRVKALKDRLEIVRQRVMRNPCFKKQLNSVYEDVHSAAMVVDDEGGTAAKQAVYGLASLEGMCSSETIIVLGRMMRTDDGRLWLEDESCRVSMTLAPEVTDPPAGQAPSRTEGIFHEGAIVIASGTWIDDVFRCDMLGMPAAEQREHSIAAFPTQVDFFGAAPPTSQARATAARLRNCLDHTMVFAAHVQADAPGTLQRLTQLASGLNNPEEYDPTQLCIVLAGNFSREPFVYGDPLSTQEQQAREHERFATLMEQIADAIVRGSADVANYAQFIFIPGPGDPVPCHGVLPMHPIPDTFAAAVRRKLPNAEFAPNPGRLRFLSVEMVVYRDEVYRRLRRHCVIPPNDEDEKVVTKTLADQAHLCPIPTRNTAIIPAYDPFLRLYPLPHLVILADRDREWESEYCGCQFINPGNFSRSGSFVFYKAADGTYAFNKVGNTPAPAAVPVMP